MYGPDAFPPMDDKLPRRTTTHPFHASPTPAQGTLPESPNTSSTYLAFAAGVFVGAGTVLLGRRLRFGMNRAAGMVRKREYEGVRGRFNAYGADPQNTPYPPGHYNAEIKNNEAR